MKKKIKKFVIEQGCGIYRNEIAVLVGYSASEAYKYAKKMKWKKHLLDIIDKHGDFVDRMLDGLGTPQLRSDGTCLVFFKSWDGSMDNYDTLYHEMYHSVRHIADSMSMSEEEEACAYLIEYLHREIRRKLNKKAGIR